MVTEHVVLSVLPGREAEYEKAFAEAKHVIASATGCRSVSVSRSVENPSNYLLLVEWDSVEHHMEGFRNSEAFVEWRRLTGHLYEPNPVIEHYIAVDTLSN
ncbi:MAG: antibiotic biosynthesis monooxygenase [Cryobacterium sp.]|nr:antibiotic biosynthesis monooxygenase [Cryobacterium sp.]